jgi:gluconokinase
MSLICFDISSNGVSAALFDSALDLVQMAEGRWTPAAALPLRTIVDQFKQSIAQLNLANAGEPIEAICVGSFMHNVLLLDGNDVPLTPVSTWLDSSGANGVEYVRSRLGEKFHARTGCRYHPMFPVFKLAALRLNDKELLEKAARAVSLKSFLLHALTGSWVEDDGMASASGLYNILEDRWDPELVQVAGLTEKHLPFVRDRTEIIGRVTSVAASEFGLPANAAVINGSGDGFLANLGSECETPAKIAVTLGTSAVARQTVPRPVLNSTSGTFCYKAAADAYLLGCAGNNGGNVLDWGRSILGTLKDAGLSADPPIFIPLLYGERSPEWDPQLKGSWHGLSGRHTAIDLSRSILEGVIFNVAYFADIVQNTSGEKPSDIVLSGNGFLHPLAPSTLAAVADATAWMPSQPGLATLRGAGVCALRALHIPVPPLKADMVPPLKDSKVHDRYRKYRQLRVIL